MILRWLLPRLMMSYDDLPAIPSPGGGGSSGRGGRPRSVPIFGNVGGGGGGGGGEEREGPSSAARDRREIVGGYAYEYPAPVGPGSLGLMGPGTYPSAAHNWTPYRNGDQRRILGRLVNQGSIYDLQLSLVQAGLLDDDDVAFGYLDSTTEDAFGDILALANQNGMDWRDVLSQAAAGGGIGGNDSYGVGGRGSKGGLDPEILPLPNRDDLIAAVEETALSKYGQRLDDDLHESAADALLDTLRTQQERQVQRTYAALDEAGEGATHVFVEDAPGMSEGSMARLLDEEIRERAPNVVMDKGVRDAMDSWFAALAGPV
jgi:hypothetical protein